MGAFESSGKDNNELVDNLMKSGYIRTKKVEQVFRAVDRGDYVLPKHRKKAYKDLAWKHDKIHLSAPCVYSEVMESLSLKPGLSFLNLGSGTGYLSTMAGLILNQHGTNHGIELYEDCLNYAYKRLEEFKQKSLALDEFDFCEPLFVQGNCLNVAPDRQYDRVYCGAACPETHEAYIKQFVRIGGILVMPYKDHLLRVRRIDEDTWLHFMMLPVTFATLVVPTAAEQTTLYLPECNPLSLRELCRSNIRNRLRENVWNEHEDLETKKPILPEQFIMPIDDESSESSSDDTDDDEFTHTVSLIINVTDHPSDSYNEWRAIVQCNRNEIQEWQQTADNNRSDRLGQDTANTESGNVFSKEESLSEAGAASNTENNSNSMEGEEESSTRSQTANNANETITTDTYLDESDSETKDDDTFGHRKKVAKREKTDSGIMEDANLSSEDRSSSNSSNSSSSSSSNTIHSDSDIVEPADNVDAMDMDLGDMLSSICNSHSVASDVASSKEEVIAHYVNNNALSTYMMEKIHQLPLPFSLKLYVNYNRQL